MFSKIISISSNGENDTIDINDTKSQAVTESELDRGILIFVFGSTSAIKTIESKPGLKMEIPNILSRLVPQNTIYKYDMTWRDPIRGQEAGKSRQRKVVIQMMGE